MTIKRTYRILMYEGPEGFFNHSRNYINGDRKFYTRGGSIQEIFIGDPDDCTERYIHGFNLGYQQGKDNATKDFQAAMLSAIRTLLVKRLKIPAIKLYRAAYNVGLKEAKEGVDIIELNLLHPQEDGYMSIPQYEELQNEEE